MSMRPRQDLVTSFSTFLLFEGDRPQGWQADPRLRRSMDRCLAQDPQEAGANVWALYWHRHWQREPQPQVQPPLAAHPLAAHHLNAYVQESCYWAAQKTASRFRFDLADCFQMAIAQFHKILRGFDSTQGTDFAHYAQATFASLIRETLRQRQELDICTPWGLLRKLSKKRLTEALHMSGLGTQAVAQHLLAWQAFKLHYVPQQPQGTRKLAKPSPEEFATMVQFYNRERGSQLAPKTPSLTPPQLEAMLLGAAQAARAYLYPTQLSINAPKGDQESEFIDDLPETEALPPLEALVQRETLAERQAQRSQLGDILRGAIADLDHPSQALLGYYYRDNLTQQEMAARLEIKQYTVSRRLTRLRKSLMEQLLKATASWHQEQTREALHSSQQEDLWSLISTLLEEWLQQYYSESLDSESP